MYSNMRVAEMEEILKFYMVKVVFLLDDLLGKVDPFCSPAPG